MTVHRSKLRISAALVALALGATACGGADGDGSGEGEGGVEAATGGSFSTFIFEPDNPLLPSSTSGTEGGQIVDALFTGLVTYDPQSSELLYEGVAESIESDDSRTWTVTLKDGWTFHDGSPVTSESFINAWNYAANSTNAQDNSYFFNQIEGYDQLQAADGAAAPAATEMSGLDKLDDRSFTITLTSPFHQFPLVLGYTAFFPLPAAFFADAAAQEAFGTRPIGNGPFQADTDFEPGKGITLSRYEDYYGEKAKADSVELRVYTDQNVAYTDLQGGNLDIVHSVPPNAITSYQDEFADQASERVTSQITTLNFPTYDARFQDKRVRQAFSMAIDRAGITQAIFDGTRSPAFSLISPVVDGHREDACQYCEYKPDEAKALLETTGFDTSQPVELWFNAGAGHDEWMQAVGNNLRENLGITYELEGGLQGAEYFPRLSQQDVTGPFRFGWVMDYPSPQNYLEPLFGTAALPPNGSNFSFYSNPQFDELITEGNGAEDDEAAIAAYHEAEDLLLEDMPVAPLFFTKQQTVWSEDVSNVTLDAFTRLRLDDVTVNQ